MPALPDARDQIPCVTGRSASSTVAQTLKLRSSPVMRSSFATWGRGAARRTVMPSPLARRCMPISAVASTSDGIRLRISKQEVQDLPPVDVDHPGASTGGGEGNSPLR